jgi:hypothetical protein
VTQASEPPPFRRRSGRQHGREKKALAIFDKRVGDFVEHVAAKGPLPGIEKAERAARSTTNQDKKPTG